MKVARLSHLGEPLKVDNAEKPRVGSTDVLVRVAACSLVPNAANLVKNGPLSALPSLPVVFGLDVSGIVEEVGSGVLSIRVGERVYVDPFLTCRACASCRHLRSDLCEHGILRAYLTFGRVGAEKRNMRYGSGGLAEYVLSPDSNIVKLPDSIDDFTAARLGYLGTSYAGLLKAGAGRGRTLVIHGATGTLGYAAVAIALGLGCSKIFGLGRNEERLAQLRAMDANGRVVTCSTVDGTDVEAWLNAQTHDLGVDAVFDCLGVGGASHGTEALLKSVRPGGRVILAAGSVDGSISQSYWGILMHDVTVLGTLWFSSAEIDELVALIASGAVDTSYLSHEVYPLERVNDAIALADDRPGGAANIVVVPSQ